MQNLSLIGKSTLAFFNIWKISNKKTFKSIQSLIMKKIYTWDAKPARRNLTVADIKSKKGKEKLTQVTANTADEAHAAGEASIDMILWF